MRRRRDRAGAFEPDSASEELPALESAGWRCASAAAPGTSLGAGALPTDASGLEPRDTEPEEREAPPALTAPAAPPASGVPPAAPEAPAPTTPEPFSSAAPAFVSLSSHAGAAAGAAPAPGAPDFDSDSAPFASLTSLTTPLAEPRPTPPDRTTRLPRTDGRADPFESPSGLRFVTT